MKKIEVWFDGFSGAQPSRVGFLFATLIRGKEVFSFEYSSEWLRNQPSYSLDPSLALYKGVQYAPQNKENFGVFLDSSPDRWGRMLMRQRESQKAREERRKERVLLESDYLLGVYDGHRMGALRFKMDPEGPFLDHQTKLASPPWISLRELEQASLALEKEDAQRNHHYKKWLSLLIVPGSSLGGARPKASVVDTQGNLWIAKFPSSHDEQDVGAWEECVHRLARQSHVTTTETIVRAFHSRQHTFLTKRFDRTHKQQRIHFASAMTLLQRNDGDDFSTGASYLEFAEFLMRQGEEPDRDLEQLWRRIVFFICISNTDDHLRNHGFLLSQKGWCLAPAYDMNPVPTSHGLKLNISEHDNTQSLELAKEVASYFRVKPQRAFAIIKEVTTSVKSWRKIAKSLHLPSKEIEKMAPAFRVAEAMK